MINKDPYTSAQEKAFIKWIATQPSCLSGDIPTICAHIRRIGQGAGVGRKPRLFGVPMTVEEHNYQTQHGERASFIKYGKPEYMKDVSAGAVKEWFEYRAREYQGRFLELNS